MAKPEDLIVVSRSEIAELAKRADKNDIRTQGEIKGYSNVISLSRPLTPLLEKVFETGAMAQLKREEEVFRTNKSTTEISDEYAQAKQQFLNSDIL